MEHFKPDEALKGYWRSVKESDTFEDFCEETGFDQEDEEYAAAKKYYKDWKDKIFLINKSSYFDTNHVIGLSGLKIKQLIVVAEEENLFYFFVKE